MKNLSLILVVWVLGAGLLSAQDTEEPVVKAPSLSGPSAGYLEMGDAFFATLQKGEVAEAFDALTKNSELANKTAEMDGLKTKTREGMDLVGGVKSAEVVKVEPAGAHLVRVTYLAYGSKFPLRWLFYFYEVDQVWRLIDLRVDDSLVRMFGEQEATP